ncbi:hypothetical protein B0H19DRAFT_1124280 [Mycena capillaripes]|nr:hypothetical protein B0H19DRAFT_1124280 [Mycena capillaripes]
MSSSSNALSSRLEDLKIFQNPPPSSEVALARQLVSQGKQQLEELRAEIAKLKLREEELQKYIDKHKRIISSINHFPPEILCMIFFHTLPSDVTIHPVTRESPWLVSQVCKLWREVALSSQVLWSFPKIHPYPNQSSSQFNLHLARSGNARLHPLLSGSPRRDIHLSRLYTSVIAHSERWVTLTMAMNWILLKEKFAALKGRVSQLEELHIHGVWSGGVALPVGKRLDAFLAAPRLRTLSVKNVCEPAVSLVLPWHQLTCYRAFSGSHEHIAVLRLCPNLIAADLNFLNLPTGVTFADNAPVMVQLRHLVQLTVGDSEFLRIISAPALQRIVVQKMGSDDDALLPLLGFIRRERPPLSSISLVRSSLVTPTLVSVLTETPRLNTLRVHIRREDAAAADELIARLTIGTDNVACFAPNLTTLEFMGRGLFNQERFVDMLKSRWALAATTIDCACMRLKHISFTVRKTPKSKLSPATIQGLRELQEDGLVVSISSFPLLAEDVATYASK